MRNGAVLLKMLGIQLSSMKTLRGLANTRKWKVVVVFYELDGIGGVTEALEYIAQRTF